MTFYNSFFWVAICWVVCIYWSYCFNIYFWSCSINISCITSCSFAFTFVASFISYFNIYFITWFDWISCNFEISFIISCASTDYIAIFIFYYYWSIWLIWFTSYSCFVWVAISWVVCVYWGDRLDGHFRWCSVDIKTRTATSAAII